MDPKFKIGQIVYFFRYNFSFLSEKNSDMKNTQINSIKIYDFKIMGCELKEFSNYKVKFVYKLCLFCDYSQSFYCLEEDITETKEKCIALLIKNFTEKFSLAITD